MNCFYKIVSRYVYMNQYELDSQARVNVVMVI